MTRVARRLRYLLPAAVAAVALTAIVWTQPVRADQPHMHAALAALRSARAELAAASPDHAGHRVEALRLVDAAIVQVEAGIAAAR